MPLDGVNLKLAPHNGIAGNTMAFIALEGSMRLYQEIVGATVDGTAEY